MFNMVLTFKYSSEYKIKLRNSILFLIFHLIAHVIFHFLNIHVQIRLIAGAKLQFFACSFFKRGVKFWAWCCMHLFDFFCALKKESGEQQVLLSLMEVPNAWAFAENRASSSPNFDYLGKSSKALWKIPSVSH